jgi:hypothetical protein
MQSTKVKALLRKTMRSDSLVFHQIQEEAMKPLQIQQGCSHRALFDLRQQRVINMAGDDPLPA